MTDSGPDPAQRELTPDDAFDLLGDGTRVEILRTLGDADGRLSFSALYDRVDVQDTGQFNYHLDKLVDHFVEKTDGGYRLTRAGTDVVRVVIAGTVTAGGRVEPTVIDAACPVCDEPIEIAYRENTLTGSCTACDGVFRTGEESGTVFNFPLPPAGVADREPEDVFRAAVAHTAHRLAAFRDGVCPTCSGRVVASVHVCERHETDSTRHCPACERPHMAEVRDRCQVCGNAVVTPVRTAVLFHPAVTAFYYDHGVERRSDFWAAYRRSHAAETRLAGTDPLELDLTLPAGDERLHLTVNGDLRVVDVRRSER